MKATPGWVREWADRYVAGMGLVEARLFDEVGPDVAARGHYEPEEFSAVARWKTPRSKPRIAANPADDVRDLTAAAFAAPERLQHRILTLLDGVRVPTQRRCWRLPSLTTTHCSTCAAPRLSPASASGTVPAATAATSRCAAASPGASRSTYAPLTGRSGGGARTATERDPGPNSLLRAARRCGSGAPRPARRRRVRRLLHPQPAPRCVASAAAVRRSQPRRRRPLLARRAWHLGPRPAGVLRAAPRQGPQALSAQIDALLGLGALEVRSLPL